MERPELSISMHRTGADEAVLRPAGEIDMLTAGQLSAAVAGALTEGPSRVLLDMAGITFCDSQGLGTLVVLSRKASSAQSVLVLTNVADFLLRVLDITGLRSALMIRNGADHADGHAGGGGNAAPHPPAGHGRTEGLGGGVPHDGIKPDRPEWGTPPPNPQAGTNPTTATPYHR